jgi:hypothetical protein
MTHVRSVLNGSLQAPADPRRATPPPARCEQSPPSPTVPLGNPVAPVTNTLQARFAEAATLAEFHLDPRFPCTGSVANSGDSRTTLFGRSLASCGSFRTGNPRVCRNRPAQASPASQIRTCCLGLCEVPIQRCRLASAP